MGTIWVDEYTGKVTGYSSNVSEPATVTRTSLVDSLINKEWAFKSLYYIESLFPVKDRSNPVFTEEMEIVVTSVSVNAITHAPIESYIGGEWAYTTGRQELKQLDITFRDISGLSLYNWFKATQRDMYNLFPDDQKWEIRILALKNDFTYSNATSSNYKLFENTTPVVDTKKALITNISSVSFDSSSNEVVTFSVTFMFT